MMDKRFIFTVTAGRSGQASFSKILRQHVPACYVAFEEPNIKNKLPGVLGNWERKFRRRFIETHELLGRGQVLTAFERGDAGYIEKIAKLRIQLANRQLLKHDANTYFDVSKYFARGLHLGFAGLLPSISLVRLVRDPVLNMRSFLNRKKRFQLDNLMPSSPTNLLRIKDENMELGELYLWAWCELYLRFNKLIEDYNVERYVDIRTEELSHPAKMNSALDTLGLLHSPVTIQEPANTNAALGFGKTVVEQSDVNLFEKFISRIRSDLNDRISYFNNYDPTQNLQS